MDSHGIETSSVHNWMKLDVLCYARPFSICRHVYC